MANLKQHLGGYALAADGVDVGATVAPATGSIRAEHRQTGALCQTVLHLTDVPVSVTDANAYGSQKLYDLPEGRLLVLGAVASIQWAVTSTRASTINDSAGLAWAVGTAAASATSLSSTMVDLIPSTSKTLSAAAAAYNTASTAALSASAQFDGTSTAKDVYLNAAFATGTDIDGNGTMKASGTITITWVQLGDY